MLKRFHFQVSLLVCGQGTRSAHPERSRTAWSLKDLKGNQSEPSQRSEEMWGMHWTMIIEVCYPDQAVLAKDLMMCGWLVRCMFQNSCSTIFSASASEMSKCLLSFSLSTPRWMCAKGRHVVISVIFLNICPTISRAISTLYLLSWNLPECKQQINIILVKYFHLSYFSLFQFWSPYSWWKHLIWYSLTYLSLDM